MATKTFKEICVEYANQLGKGLPLTPAEMCNAVIMYLNQQVDVMNQFVQTALNAVSDIQQDISEYPAPENIVSTNQNQNINSIKTFNGVQEFNDGINSNNGKIASVNICASDTGTYDGVNRVEIKPDGFISRISPSGTKNILLPDKDGELAVVSDIPNVPDIPNPTTSDNGKVLGVQSGAYALVEQSGGEAPANMVTTDTKQTITAQKTYIVDDSLIAQFADGQSNFINVGRTNIDINDFRYGYAQFGRMPSAMISIPNKAGTLALTDDIPNTDNFVTVDTTQSIIGNKTFTGNVDVTQGRFYTNNISFLPMSGGSVSFNPPSTTQERTITLPDKNGTVALVDDIPNITNLVTTNTEQNITATKNFSIIQCGDYTITDSGFFCRGAIVIRYSGSQGAVVVGNSTYKVNIYGTSLTFNGEDVLTAGSGVNKLYNHYISCTVTGIGITSSLNVSFNFISSSATAISELYNLSKAIKNRILSCSGDLGYSVDGDDAIPIYITSDGSRILMGYITQGSNNKGEVSLTSLATFDFSDSVNEI